MTSATFAILKRESSSLTKSRRSSQGGGPRTSPPPLNTPLHTIKGRGEECERKDGGEEREEQKGKRREVSLPYSSFQKSVPTVPADRQASCAIGAPRWQKTGLDIYRRSIKTRIADKHHGLHGRITYFVQQRRRRSIRHHLYCCRSSDPCHPVE